MELICLLSLDKRLFCSNCVTQSEGGQVCGSKCPELLARYCDQILRKSARRSEDTEMEELLTQVVSTFIMFSFSKNLCIHSLLQMIIFKYIEDKDVFQKYYTKMFAKRLVGELSASDDAESLMIAKLKQVSLEFWKRKKIETHEYTLK